MANPLDASEMTDEQLEAAMVMEPATQDPTTQPEPEGEPAPTPVADSEPVYELDGETLTAEQLREWRAGKLRQDDYTRKTQALKEEREKLGPMAELIGYWENNPASRPLILDALAKEAGVNLPTSQPATQPTSGYDPNLRDSDGDLVPEWRQRGFYSEVEMRQDQQIRQMGETMTQFMSRIENHLTGQQRTQERDALASNAAKALEADLGIKGITAEEVRDAMTATGLDDPEAAFLKHNKARLMTFAKGTAPAKPTSPSPDGVTRTFDPMAEGMTWDKINSMLEQGYVSTVPIV